MKKSLLFILGFIFTFMFYLSSEVCADTLTYDGINITFGDEDKFNFYYVDNYNFELKDKSFYYDGIKYTFNDDYSYVNSDIKVTNRKFELNGEVLSLDLVNNLILGEKLHYHYAFPVFVTVDELTKTYDFSQQICYKYNEIEACNIDENDVVSITQNQTSIFYYSFLPFYNKDIVFDYIEYRFTLSDGESVINLDPIRYEKEEIIYHESFSIDGYNNVTVNGEKSFISPITSYLENEKINVFVSFIPSFRYGSDVTRYYDATFYSCVGNNYQDCSKISFDGEETIKIPHNAAYYYNMAIPNLTYNKQTMEANYDSFMIKGSYVCVENCDDPISQVDLTFSNEQIYYFSFMTPEFKGEINGKKGTCYIGYFAYTCYGANNTITNKIEFKDDNGIEEVYYYFSESRINKDSEIVNKINNGENIVLNPTNDGYHYLYYKVIDGSGAITTNINNPYIYLFDREGPINPTTNFDSYNSQQVYNSVSLTISYNDTYMGDASKIYYIIANENDSVSIEDVVNGNEYYSGFDIKDNINGDGKYKVCFVGEDYLGNYSPVVTCTQVYTMDITGLRKDEVTITYDNTSYQNSIDIYIDILGVENNTSFACALVYESTIISNSSQLSTTCLNKSNNSLTSIGEGKYHLWIYASDYVGNYSLIKFDDVYLLDNLAPRVSYSIIGNNEVYSNNVRLDVTIEDINQLNSDSLSYEFYLNTYDEASFISFDLDNGISYPFNYYGIYKVAIKACDNTENCKITTFDDSFMIDTSIISIELLGEEVVTILKWSKYKEAGVKASKGNGGKSPVEVEYKIEGEVDYNNVGTYYLTYTSGEGINKVSVTRTVIVKDNSFYIIGLVSFVVIGESIILLRLFVKKRKNDSI